MHNYPCFEKKKLSHSFQENDRDMDWNKKVLGITYPASGTKTKVIYGKK